MDSLSSDFEELLALLNAHNVEALIVGGHALAFHGRPRYTKDLDIFSSPGKIVQLGVAPDPVDLMTATDGVTFDEAWADRVQCGRATFLKNKRAAGRPQDVANIDAIS